MTKGAHPGSDTKQPLKLVKVFKTPLKLHRACICQNKHDHLVLTAKPIKGVLTVHHAPRLDPQAYRYIDEPWIVAAVHPPVPGSPYQGRASLLGFDGTYAAV